MSKTRGMCVNCVEGDGVTPPPKKPNKQKNPTTYGIDNR